MKTSLRYALLACLAAVSAAPLLERDSIGVSSALLAQLQLFAQYSASAYCYENVQDLTGTISCSGEGGTCPLIQSAQTSILEGFADLGDFGTTGYVATDHTNGLIVVSIQGTSLSSNPIDFLTDVDVIPVQTNLCGSANTHDGCSAHDGFYAAALAAFPVVSTNVASAIVANPSYQIVCTGHSLGGAIAALLATMLRNQGHCVDLYTYGQPHLGTVDISNYIQNQAPALGENYRATHWNDVVSQLPEHDWPGDWDHYYPEYWIDIDLGTITISDIKIVTGSLYETGGNEGKTSGWGFLVDIIEGAAAHTNNYFGAISACDSSEP